MASLIDTLAEILNKEDEEYQKLLDLSQGKTEVIVKGDINALSLITDKEQEVVSRINSLENKRSQAMKEIAKILNTDVRELKLETLISLLGKKPREQKALSLVHDKLHATLYEMKLVNERNAELLKNAIEMVDFNMNLIQAMRKAPENANYNRGAYNTGDSYLDISGTFDAKQ